MFRKKRRHRWFFATDIHGSDRCYKKFLAAAAVYEAEILVLGGDVAGKGIVPIVEDGSSYSLTFQGVTRSIGPNEVAQVCEQIAFNGLYPLLCDTSEIEQLRVREARDAKFREMITQQLHHWMRLTEERVDPAVRCIVTPGNDDPLYVDEILATAGRVECPEQRIAEVGAIQLASLGNTNVTPWHTDREYTEEELAEQIGDLLSHTDRDRPLVVNFHCPPFDSALDRCPVLDADYRPVVRMGAVAEAPVGSTAVRDAIEQFGPEVGLHGHIHEAQGVALIGTTRCFNPGSDYSSGVLNGVIVDFDERGRYVDHLFTAG